MDLKKVVTIDDVEYSFPDDPDQNPQSATAAEKGNRFWGAPKKGMKGGAKAKKKSDDDGDEPAIVVAADPEDDEEPVNLVFSCKKSSSAFSALNSLEEEDVVVDDDRSEVVNNKKKLKKKKAGNKFALEEEDDDDDKSEVVDNNHMDEEKDEEFDFDFGKKKKSMKKKGGSKFALEEEEEDKSEITVNTHVEDEMDEESKDLDFDFGKKKKSKKGGKTAQGEEDLDKLLAELGEGPPPLAEEVPPPAVEELKEAELDSKKRKKKKTKSGRSAQEEDDLDKILVELGERPASSSAPSLTVEEPVQVQSEAAEAEEKEGEAGDAVESAAANKKKMKKKKKKEKEKEKKAAAKEEAEAKEEVPAKRKALDNKKLPKHVKEIREALARRKDKEERRRREAEERLRREVQERLRREEEEEWRLAKEERRRKKEMEKEKLLKKNQERMLLMVMQKEDLRRLVEIRRQTFGQNEVPAGDAPVEVKKRPKYESKKSKQKVVEAEKPRENPKAVAEPEVEQAKEDVMNEESQSQAGEVEDKVDAIQDQVEAEVVEEDEDDEKWDAKRWDHVDANLPATSPFAEDTEEEDAQAVVREGAPALVEPTKKTTASCQPSKETDGENNVNKHEEVKRKKEVVKKKKINASEDTSQKSSGNELRSPICCVLGHVDTGKTKLVNCIRRTSVQEGEAGGITQQIGATYFPTENIRERTKELKADATLKVPGLLVIDTPGHESFAKLRSRGSSLCDIAVLVVDIIPGLMPQTIESLNLLKSCNTEFIVALNKVDLLYGWKPCPYTPIIKSMKQQSNDVKNEFNMKLTQIITEFKEEGLNTALYYKSKVMGETFNIVPASAISGDGIPDLLLLLIQWARKIIEDKLTYVDEVECTVLEVKVIEGLGTTIDVVLVNGVLHERDQIVVCGIQGPLVPTVRALLTPHPLEEVRLKGTYLHHKEIKAAQGIKISAQFLEHAIAGTALYVVGQDDDLEDYKETVMPDMKKVMGRIDKSGEGVCVQASALGTYRILKKPSCGPSHL